MSQAGIIDIEQSHPQIPTSFVTNTGTAIPIGNVLEILGTTVAAHSIPLETTGSGNTVTVEAQFASAAASSVATNAGFASFNSSEFTVDANGFVSISGTGAGETITGNSGGPLSPVAGNWNIFGASTAAGAIPVTTVGSGNTLTVDVQKSQAIATTNATNVGLSAFNSAEFTVDANGFVSLVGGGNAIEKIALQTGTTPIVPASGLITFNGAVVAAGTNPVQTNGTAASTMQLQVQTAQAIASTNAANIGLAAFNSADFTVDANGFVTLSGTVDVAIRVDTSTAPGTNPVVPAAGIITVTGGQVAAGTTANVIQTDSLAANTYTIQIQRSQAVATSTIGDNGVSHFNSADFIVDSNGFVSITNFTPFAYTQINHASSPYTVLSTDNYISADPTAGTISILLPNAPTTFRKFIIKDRTGTASTNNISVTTVGGAVTIDGQTTYTIAGNFGAIELLFNGTSYEVY